MRRRRRTGKTTTTMGETMASSKGGRGDKGGSGKGEDRQGREQARGTGGETVGELTRRWVNR